MGIASICRTWPGKTQHPVCCHVKEAEWRRYRHITDISHQSKARYLILQFLVSSSARLCAKLALIRTWRGGSAGDWAKSCSGQCFAPFLIPTSGNGSRRLTWKNPMAVRNWSWINSSFHHCQKLKRAFAVWELQDFLGGTDAPSFALLPRPRPWLLASLESPTLDT